MSAPGKILVVLQFWSGDKGKAMHLARLIADIQQEKDARFEFAFFARFDATHDEETVNYVSRKFNVWKLQGTRQVTGWPDGCNAVALEAMQQAYARSKTSWKDVKAVYLIESDVMPLVRDWLPRLEKEWDKAAADGKLLMGAWYPFHSVHGHINGNMLLSPVLYSRIKNIELVAPGKAWDTELAPKFAPYWHKSLQMQNHYDFKREIPADILFSSVDGVTPPVVVHGVKDFSAERQAKAVMFR